MLFRSGWGAGTLLAEVLNRATGRKRGREIQLIAAAGIVLAAIVRLGLADVPLLLVVRDLAGLTMVVMAISAATARLR